MIRRTISIPNYISKHCKDEHWHLDQIEIIKDNIIRLRGKNENPLVTIIIPAYNEQSSILQTLSSLSETETNKSIEILVVDNNSNDRTKEYILKAGAKYTFEGAKGVKNAREAGLRLADSKYILNADADTIYSPFWVDFMIDPLVKHDTIACTHGKFSFIPERGYSRFSFFIYEFLGDVYKYINSLFKDKAMYVYGCSSAYRKEQAISVNGYEHPPGANEDGYLGLKLRNKFGILKQITDTKSLAWTSSRKFVADGSLLSRILKKLKSIGGS